MIFVLKIFDVCIFEIYIVFILWIDFLVNSCVIRNIILDLIISGLICGRFEDFFLVYISGDNVND